MIQNTHYYTGRPALAGTAWRILLQQSFTARMPFVTACSAFGWGRRL